MKLLQIISDFIFWIQMIWYKRTYHLPTNEYEIYWMEKELMAWFGDEDFVKGYIKKLRENLK